MIQDVLEKYIKSKLYKLSQKLNICTHCEYLMTISTWSPYNNIKNNQFSIYVIHPIRRLVRNWDYSSLNDKMIMNNWMERMWKEGVVTYSEVLSRHLHRGTEEIHEKIQ